MTNQTLLNSTTTDWEANAKRLVAYSLAELCPILRAHDVTQATIDYDGYGDEGQVNEITLHNAYQEPVDMPNIRCRTHYLTFSGTLMSEDALLDKALDRFATEALETLHAGWENDEGALGTLVINAEAGTATLEHSSRFIGYTTDTHELGA